MKVVGKSGASNKAGQEIATISQSGTSIVVSGDITAQNFFIGEQYEFEFQFSQQFIQVADSVGSRISVKEGRLQIRNWSVSFNDTGFFTTEVTPEGRSTSTSTFTGTILGSGLAGTINLEDGDFDFAVQSENDKLIVKLKAIATSAKHAKYFPTTNLQVSTGAVIKNSNVPCAMA